MNLEEMKAQAKLMVNVGQKFKDIHYRLCHLKNDIQATINGGSDDKFLLPEMQFLDLIIEEIEEEMF